MTQTDSAADRIRIVLVGTQHPGNLGSAARAMRTMGLTRMVLVAPEKQPDLSTVSMAAGAEALVFDAPVFATLEQAFCRFGPPEGHVTMDLTVSANSPSTAG